MNKRAGGDRIEAIFNRQYFLAGLNDAQRAHLLHHAQRRDLSTGELLFRQGDSAAYFYVLLEGRFKLFRLSHEGGEKIMGLVRPGDSFAEGVLFMDTPCYPVNAEALARSEVLAISRATYLELLAGSFETCRTVMGKLTGRIQSLINEIETLTLRNSRYRVLKFLSDLLPGDIDEASEAALVHLPARKNEIAAQLAIRPETLSRTLARLEAQGVLRMRGHSRIELLDPAALRRLLGD